MDTSVHPQWAREAWALAGIAATLASCAQAALDPPATRLQRSAATVSATDPGPRPGAPGAGAPATPQPVDPNSQKAQKAAGVACLPGLASSLLTFCEQAVIRFQEVDSVAGTVGTEIGAGLGPTFNGNSCAMCHAQPAVLGSSPGRASPQNPIANPQVALAHLDGASNPVPLSFITADGPVREARFVLDAVGRPDGSVHDLFTITGRVDANSCMEAQPDFPTQLANHNVIFRIPTPLFGDGLVENTPDATLQSNPLPKDAPPNDKLGIFPHVFNISGNDQTITRFGWKAQNKSLLVFAGEAYNVEQGVSNENFPNERAVVTGCALNPTPEDTTPSRKKFPANSLSDASSDTVNFAMAMRLSTPPAPALPLNVSQQSVGNGQTRFVQIGCANCHSPSLTTGPSSIDPALSNVTFNPFSDFALHHMGSLGDGITQGGAGPDQFRTAPLWGAGQRLFFLHDGRTTDIVQAILAHQSDGSEASIVISNFIALDVASQQDLVNFLRSL
jgi:CxxC motif-containing protein (DUF1111 family)